MSANEPLNVQSAEEQVYGSSQEMTASPQSVKVLDQSRPPHPGFWMSVLWCLGFLFCTQVPGAIVGAIILIFEAVVLQKTIPSGDLKDVLASEPIQDMLKISMFFTEVLVIAVSWLVIRLVVGKDWTRQLALRRPSVAHFALVVAVFPALALTGDLSYYFLRHVLKVPSLADLGFMMGMEEAVKAFSQWPWPFAVLVIGLGPGIGEELWCRGFLGRGLVGRYGAWVGVLLTSFFFGLIHVDPCQGIMAMVMGIVLHFVYLTTRSLWLPMLLHFLNNSLAVVSSRIPYIDKVGEGPGITTALVYVTAFFLLFAVCWALYASRARLKAEDETTVARWQPTYPGVEYPPPKSGAVIRHTIPSRANGALALTAFLAFIGSCVVAALKS